ncbi:MAG: chromosome segregation protein SMC [Aerococcus sp.]|nr:chromosome segregation protein SMC [Aerococcus sp.]
MYLKGIKLIGFKSFAEKTRIDLNQNFTAIVGPNGSGKSNITEAIKWVLGEQSAKSLRGERMDDVIFAGSSSKERSQYAEVALEFDNHDHTLDLEQEEVCITRRFTRKGESTYRINGKQCRLKDITELMMDTGIGKHSFSVISQGRVEEIFNQKAEERRSIFEEAAGVIKYKAKKQEAERKLTRSLENQDRLDDIMSEIETRLTPLLEQRNTALSYQEKKQALSEIEIALISVEIEAQSKAWELSKQELTHLEAGIRQEKAALSLTHEQMQEQQDIATTAENEREQLHNELVTLVQQIEQGQSALELDKQRFLFQQKDQSERIERLRELTETYQTQLADYEAAQHSAQQIAEELAKQTKNCQQHQEALKQLEMSRTVDVEALRNRYFDYLQDESHLKNQLTSMEKDQALLNQQRLDQKRQQKQWEQEQATFEAEQTKAQETLAKATQQVDALTQKYQQNAQTLSEAEKNLQNFQKQYDTTQHRYLKVNAEYESLRALEANYEGFYYGVKNALKLSQQIDGIHGAVAQLLEVPSEYTLAVETALGGQMQNIITETGAVAEQVIQQLKRQRGGRATFLPLDVMQPRTLSIPEQRKIEQVPGYLGILVDLVTFDPHYQPVMANLMGATVVSEDLQSARRINQLLNRRVRVVSVEGDLVHAGGSLTGGMNRNQQQGGVLERQQKIADCKRQKQQLQQTINQLTKKGQALKQTVTTETEALESLKEKGTEARYQEREAKQTVDRLTQQLTSLEKTIAGAAYDSAINAEDQSTSKAKRQKLEETLTKTQRQIEEVKRQIEAANASEEHYHKEHTQLQAAYQQAQTTLAVTREQEKQQRQTKKRLQEAVLETKEALDALKDQASDSQIDEVTFKEEQAKQEQTLTQQFERQKQLKQEQNEAKKAQTAAQQAVKKLNQEQDAHNQTLERYYQDQTTTQGKIARYEVTIDTHLEHLREDYGLTYERAKEQSELTLSVEEASKRVTTLKQEIDQLGSVNLQSIAEYDEVKQRYDFMNQQREDVLNAIDNLKATIATLDKEVSAKFKASFLAIQGAFEEIFPKLFGGGKATLTLTAPNDLLHTGIEIMAQPPGKKLQLMSLLSGGERSLTAIALLFAMIAVNPVPFSILDEVEAALDDANVDRYGQYLEHYAEKTQFIVITHRKGTMEHANLLYGVTMEQAGVSKLASVQLEDMDWDNQGQSTSSNVGN